MGNRVRISLLGVLVVCYGLVMAMGHAGEEELYWSRGRGDQLQGGQRPAQGEGEELFLLQDSKHVVKTDAGDMRVVRSLGGRIIEKPLHIGFISMEPNTLFIPQYLDSSLILFVRRGEARVGCIYKDEVVERRLKMGDLYPIPAGSAFYIVNTGDRQRLHIICSIDISESLGLGSFQSFFIGGGTSPTSVIAGFDTESIRKAFNVSASELKDLLSRQQQGPIVYVSKTDAPGLWTKFVQLKEQDRLQQVKRMVLDFQNEDAGKKEEESAWAWLWRKLLNSVFGSEDTNKKERSDGSPESYNLYERRPDFKNDYGWSIALDETDDKSPLRHSDIGVYLVNLTAGSMMAPHMNPIATEYGIVLRGKGRVQIVFPNGTLALNAKVKEGDVFWVPRYLAFCQIASRTGPFEFFGFTTSARKNRPQFLAGKNSLLHALGRAELATAFGVSEERIRRFLDAQREAVILPSPVPAVTHDDDAKHKDKEYQELNSAVI